MKPFTVKKKPHSSCIPSRSVTAQLPQGKTEGPSSTCIPASTPVGVGAILRLDNNLILRNSQAYGTYWPSFRSPLLENMGVVLNNKGYQMIELFILLQLIQVLTPGLNLINFYEDQKEVGVRKSISHK